jgi:GDP-mannose 6-dehydrogenase
MRIGIFGLGHIGCVSAVCFAQTGHHVMGYDINREKVAQLNQGLSPVLEKDIDLFINEQVQNGDLKATDQLENIMDHSEVIIICVDTPSNGSGSINLQAVKIVCRDIGKELRKSDRFVVITLRSTIMPELIKSVAVSILEKNSNKICGRDFGFVYNPEFLREGTAIDDFFHPPRTIIAASDPTSERIMEDIYSAIDAPLFKMTIEEAAMVKYADNAFHAVKVAFANEIGRFCKAQGIDSRKVMDVFVQDYKLNLSPYYLKPGFAFGGSCLPKDLRAIVHQVSKLNITTPLLKAVMTSNDEHVDYALRMLEKYHVKRVGILGLSFKTGTDDLRESPIVRFVNHLLQNDYKVKIYDRFLAQPHVIESTRKYIKLQLPDLKGLLCTTLEELLDSSELIVFAHTTQEHRDLVKKLRKSYKIIDLAGVNEEETILTGERNYEGICW